MAGQEMWIIVGSLSSALILLLFLFIGWVHYKRKKAQAPAVEFTHAVNNDITIPRTYESMSSSTSESECQSRNEPSFYPGTGYTAAYPHYVQQDPGRAQSHVASLQRSFSSIHRTAVGALHAQVPYMSTDDDDDDRENEESCGRSGTEGRCQGRVWMSINYESINHKLIIYVNKVKYLPGRGMTFDARNVFCRVYLLPDETSYLQSKSRKRTLAPKFNDTFVFFVEPEVVKDKTVRMSLYDMDKRKVRHALGHVLVPLSSIDLTSTDLFCKDLDIQQIDFNQGEIQVGLYCNPASDRLCITVSRISGIQGVVIGETGVRIEVRLYHGKKLMKTKWSNAMTMTSSEQYMDESFTLAVAGRHVDNCSIEIIVHIMRSFDSDQEHGHIILGSFLYARGRQLLHWQDMIANPRTVVNRKHNLQRRQDSRPDTPSSSLSNTSNSSR